MRVGLNLVYMTSQSGGAARYGRELVRSLLAVEPGIHISAFVSKEVPEDFVEAHPEVDWVRYPITVTHGGRVNTLRSVWTQWGGVVVAARRRKLQVIHGLANFTPLVAPGIARVTTLLDLIWMHHPGAMSAADTRAMKATAIPSAKLATRVVAISEAAKRDISETLDIPGERIDVTHLGVRMDGNAPRAREEDVRRTYELGDAPVVLCVAQKRVHKNLTGLIRAMALLEDRSAMLVLPGSPTAYEDELRALAAELGIADRVRFPAWVEDDELEALYALSSAFALPSFEEGFGLPLLEAMRRDVPVTCSDISSLPEVAHDAAEYFDPHDPRDIARAIDGLLASPERRRELVERGRQRCRELTWERTAEATLATYRRAIAQVA